MKPFNDAARLLRVPSFLPAAMAVLLVVLGQAIAGTFMALFAVRRAGLSPLELSVFLTASALMSIAASTVLGRRFDRHPGAAALLVVLAMNVAGFALLAVTTDFVWLVVIAALPVGVGGAAFTLLFAVAKRQLDAMDAITAERGVAALRMTTSVAWAIGPALGAVLVGYRGYEGVFLGAAGCIVIALATLVMSGIWRLPANAKTATMVDVLSVPKGRAALAVGSIGLFHMAMFMGSIALSITVVERLGGTESDVGLLFSLCAALEVLVMGCFVIRPTRGSRKLWMVSGFALFALYFVALIVFPDACHGLLGANSESRGDRHRQRRRHDLPAIADAVARRAGRGLVQQCGQRRRHLLRSADRSLGERLRLRVGFRVLCGIDDRRSDSDPDAEQSRPSDPGNSGGAVRCHPVRRGRSGVSFAHH